MAALLLNPTGNIGGTGAAGQLDQSNQSRAPAARIYRPELDILRFLAFLGVFAIHLCSYPIEFLEEHHVPHRIAVVSMALVHGGAFGVDVFFALSAYLITVLLLKEKETRGRLDVPAFYVRRALRIWPLYYLMVLLVAAIPYFNPGHIFDSRYVIPFLVFLGNWSFIWYGSPVSPANPLWSVSVEEQFYLFWPPIVARLSPRGMAWAAALMIVIANAVRLWGALLHQDKEPMWCNTFAHLDSIAVGIIIALWLRNEGLSLKWKHRIILMGVAITLFALRGHYRLLESRDEMSVAGTLVGYPAVVLGCAAVLLAFIGMPLRSKALEYLGKISYGLYAYHMLCMLVVDSVFIGNPGLPHALERLVIVFTLTIVVAAASYALIEAPFLRLKNRFTFVKSRPV